MFEAEFYQISALDDSFKSFEKIPKRIDKTFENRMKRFIESLP